MRCRWAVFAKKALDGLLILSLALAFLTAIEATLRWRYPSRAHPADDKIFFRFHADYLVELKPNIERSLGGRTGWRTNSLGFRGPELLPEPETRIMVYGDSNIQARFSLLEDTFPMRLQNYLGEGGRDVEVINAGIVGFGPDQSVLKMSAEVDRYQPDIAILHVFAENDFGDLIRNRLFDLEGDELERTPFEPTVDPLLDQNPPLREKLSRLLLTRALWKAIGQGAALFGDPADRTIASLFAASRREYVFYEHGRPRGISHFEDHYDIDIAATPGIPSARTKIALMDRILARAQSLAEAKGIELLVLIQPASTDVTTNLKVNYEVLSRYPEYDRRRLTSSVEEACVRRSIDYVNLYDVFLENAPETLYFKADSHWNAAGQALAAREVGAFIVDRYLDDHAVEHDPTPRESVPPA